MFWVGKCGWGREGFTSVIVYQYGIKQGSILRSKVAVIGQFDISIDPWECLEIDVALHLTRDVTRISLTLCYGLLMVIRRLLECAESTRIKTTTDLPRNLHSKCQDLFSWRRKLNGVGRYQRPLSSLAPGTVSPVKLLAFYMISYCALATLGNKCISPKRRPCAYS